MAAGTEDAAIKALTNARVAAMLNCQTANAALYTRAFAIEPAFAVSPL
jgi:hypothetical protein